MGGILYLPRAAEPFGGEVRRESFYVGTDPDALVLMARKDEEFRGAFSVPIGHVPALVVTLEAVQASHAYQRWSNGEGLSVDDVGPFAPAVPWTITRQDEGLVLTGRVIAFLGEGAWEPAQLVELVYRDLASLLQVIASARIS